MGNKKAFRAAATRFTFVSVWFLGLCLQAGAQTVELQEILSIGGFLDVADVEVAEDGSIYVTDSQDFTVSRYDAEGRLLRQIGRVGMGPGEFAGGFGGGPSELALINRDVLVYNPRGVSVHRFDSELNYKTSLRPMMVLTMDAGPDGRIYVGYTDVMSDEYVTVYGTDGTEITKQGIDGLSEYIYENRFTLLVGQQDTIVLVFSFANRIDVRDTEGQLLRRLSLANLPHKNAGTFRNAQPLRREVPEEVARLQKATSYIPGDPVFFMAALDHRGNVFLEARHSDGKAPSKRLVYVVDLAGDEDTVVSPKAVFQLAPRATLMHIDRDGHLYTKERLEEELKVVKYKMTYRGF